MSFLARLSLANRGLVALIALVIAAFGAFAVPSLKQQLLPSLEFPAAIVTAGYPGAAPEIVEQQVTRPVENAIQGLDGLETVTSTSLEGAASVQVEFEFGTDLDAAVAGLQNSINRIQPQLPAGVQPTVFAGSTDDLPAIVLAASGQAASGQADERALADRLRRTVLPELQAVEGVRQASIRGARDQQVVIVLNPAKIAAAGVQPGSIGAALRANGVSVPAGAITEQGRTRTVQVGSPITGLDQLRSVYLVGRRGPVRLGDVATVSQQLAAPTSLTRTNGVPSLGIAVTAAPDGNAVQISQEIRDRLDDLGAASGAELTVIFDQAPFVERSIEALTTEGLLGLLMAVIVILVFLMSVRSTLVTAVSIPLSVLVALIGLWIGDYSLNLLTLGALTIAVGRVVDDSIVVLENIKRHLGYGERRRRAILRAVREVAGAVTASTLTTVAVFAPIALVGGFVGQLFTPFAVTVTVALLASLLVSLTIIPVLAYWFLRPATGGADEAEQRRLAEARELRSPLQRGYLPVISFAVRRRWVTLLAGFLVLLGTFGLATRLETNFIDQSGQANLRITQELPVGTSLAATDAAARRVEDILAGRPDIESYQVTLGNRDTNPFAGPASANAANFVVALRPDVDATAVQTQLRAEFQRLTDAGEISVGAGDNSGVNANQLQVVVQASDPQALTAATEQVRRAMAGTPGVTEVDTSLAASAPRLDVVVDRAAAARAGLSEAAIGQLVGRAFRGAPLGQVTLPEGQQDVVLRGAAVPTTVAQLRALPIAPAGLARTLDDVADVNEVNGPVEVTRIDGNRSATVSGVATGSNVGAASTALSARLTDLDLPAGASYRIAGVSAEQREAFADLGLAVLAAIAIVFLIMVATFRSLVQPLILLVSIPFAATGAIGLLLATGTPLGVPALIGVLMLVGIVVTNAIVLMDLVNQYRAQGMGIREAVVEGGRRRLRPILMTAIATIFALLPMALGLTGQGGFISQPLAIVVIGGLLSSTLLTLVLVPTLYSMVEDAKERLRARRRSPGDPDDTSAEPVEEPEAPDDRLVGVGAPAGPSGGPTDGTGTAEPAGTPATALRAHTDQFEVLRLPRSSKSALPPTP